jgi:hypothetical protein
VGGEKPWRWERLYIGRVAMERDLHERHHFLGVTKEKRVIIPKFIPRAVGYREGEGLRPRGSALGVNCKDAVVTARFEAILEAYDVRGDVRTEPVVLVQHQRLRPSLSCWEFGYEFGSIVVDFKCRGGCGG